MKRSLLAPSWLWLLIAMAHQAAAAHPADGDWLSDDPAFQQKESGTGGRLSLAAPYLQWWPAAAIRPKAWRCDLLPRYEGRAEPSATPASGLDLVVPVCKDERRQTCVLRTVDALDCVEPGGASSRWRRIPQALSSPEHAAQAGTMLAPLNAQTARTPALGAVLAWHEALRTSDFDAYRKVAFPSVLSEQTQRMWFDQVRRSVPQRLWTAGEKPVADGETLVVVANCSGATALGAEVRAMPLQGQWRVTVPAGFSFYGRGDLFHCPAQGLR